MIFCADCIHCRQLKRSAPNGTYILEAACSRGIWKRNVAWHRIPFRQVDACDQYDSSSDSAQERDRFLQDLANSIPRVPTVFHPDGSQEEL